MHLGLALLPLASMVGCKGDGPRAATNDQARTSPAGDARATPTPQGPWVLVPFAGDPVDPARDYLGGALGDRAAWRGLAGILIHDGTLYLAEEDHTIRAAASHGGPWERAELGAFAGRRAMPSGWTGQPGTPGDGFLTAPGAMTALGGDLIVAEPSRHCLKRVPLNGPEGWTLFAGRPGTAGRQGGSAAQTRLGAPVALASDGITQVFAADAEHGLVWRFTTEGTGEAITAPGAFQDPQGLALGPDGRLYVADRRAHAIFRLTRADSGVWGGPERVAGIPGQAGFQDGGAGLLREPMGLAFDAGGHLLVADAGNHALRVLSLDGPAPVLATLAGSGPGAPDAGQPGHRDGLAQEARFHRPTRLALGQAGEIFVVEGPTGGPSTLRVVTAGQVTTLGRRDLGPVLDLPGAREFGPMGPLAATGDGRILAADARARVLRVFRGPTLEAAIPFPGGVEGPIHRLAATSDGAIRLLPREGKEVFISRDGSTWASEGRGAVLDLAAHGMAPGARVAELRARDGAYRVTLVHPGGEAHVDLRIRPQALALDAGNNLLLALPGDGGGIVLERHLAGPEGYRPDAKPPVRMALGERAGQGAILALAPLDGDRVLLADASNALVWEASFSDGAFRPWAGAFPFVESKRAPRASGDPLSALSGMALGRGGDLYLATGKGLIRASQGDGPRNPAPAPRKPQAPRAPLRPQVDPAPASPEGDPRRERDRTLAEAEARRARIQDLENRIARIQAQLQAREGQLDAARAARRNAEGEAALVGPLRTRLESLVAERNQHQAAQDERERQANARLQALIAQHQNELNRIREHLGAEAEGVRAHLRSRLAEAEAVLQAVLQGGDEDRAREAAAHEQRLQALAAHVWEVGGRLARARREGRQADRDAQARLKECQRALDQARAEAEALKAGNREASEKSLARIESLQAEVRALDLRLTLAGEASFETEGRLRTEIHRLRALNAEQEEAVRVLTPLIMDLRKAAENAALRDEIGRVDLLRQALANQVTGNPATASVAQASQRTTFGPQGRPWILTARGEAARWDAERRDLVVETRLPEGILDLAASPWNDQVAAIHQDPQGGFRLTLAGPGGLQTLGLPHRPSALALMPDGRVMLAFQAPRGWAHVVALRSTPSGLERDPSADLAFGPDPQAIQPSDGDQALAPAVNLTALAANAQGDLFLLDAPRGVLYRALGGRTLQMLATGLQAQGQDPLTPHFLQVDAQGDLLLARANEPFVLRPSQAPLDAARRESNALLPKSPHRRARLSRAATLRSHPNQESRPAMIETHRTGPAQAESTARLTSLLPLGEGRLVILDDQGRLHIQDARGQVTAFPVETGPGALRVASIARGRRGGLLLQSQNGRRFVWNPALPAGLVEQGDAVLGMALAATAQGVNHAVLQRMVDAPHPYQIAVNRQRGGVPLPGAVLKLGAQPLAWGLDGDGTLVVLRNLRNASSTVPHRVLERHRTTDLRPTEYQRCESPTPIQGSNLRGPISAHPVAVDLAVTPKGQVLVADPANHTIWRLEPGTGTLSVWAGPERLETARRQALPENRSPLQGPNGLAAVGDQGVYVTLADGVVWLPFPEATPSRPEGSESKRPAPPEEKHAAPVSESLDAPVGPTPAPLARASAERAGFRWEATLQPGDSDKGEFQVRVATTTPVGATEATIDLPDRPLAMALNPQGTLVLLRATPTGDRLISVHTHLPNRPGIYRCQEVAWIERAAAGVPHFGPMTLAVDGQGDVAVACSAHRMVWRVEPATGKVTLLAGPNELDAAIQGTFQGPRALASHPDGGWILTHDQGTLTLPRRPETPSESKRLAAALAASTGTGDDGGPEAKERQNGVNRAPDPDMAEVLREAADAIAYAESVLDETSPSRPASPATPTRARQATSPTQERAFLPAGSYGSLSPHLGRSLKR